MIKYLSLFSGIGAFEKAFINRGIPFELVGYSEIDKYASKSYSQIFGIDETENLGDITKIDEKALGEVDFVTYGFPCQDISISGHQKGLFNEDGTQTRSGLFFDALRIIKHCQPKVAIAENVKNLTSKKFAQQFKTILESLDEAGYNNYWRVLNAKDYGIPQNRERVFVVSIRKDIDTGKFEFPKPCELKLRLKDLLEDEVDDKYYLSDKMVKTVCSSGTKNFYYKPEIDLDIARPLTATMHKTHRASQDNYVSEEFVKNGNKVEIKDGVIIGGMQKHQGTRNEPRIMVVGKTRSGGERSRILSTEGICSSLTATDYKQPTQIVEPVAVRNFRIRKLTPKECFRLMGFDDSDFEKCTCSNTQLYRQAGNSVVVDVAEELLRMLCESGNLRI